MKVRIFPIVLALMATACDAKIQADNVSLTAQNAGIINGTEVTGNNHPNVVSLKAYENSMCTGTLITPNFVLTAAHCVDPNDDDVMMYRDDLQIGIGQKVWDLDHLYDIEAFYVHPKYSMETLDHDIALIKLKTPVPESVAKPAVAMPPSLDLTGSDIDAKGGVSVKLVGYGNRDIYGWGDDGEKYETELRIYARCPMDESYSRNCTSSRLQEFGELSNGIFYVDGTQTGPCFGDSGGPALYWRDGVQYVIGVASFVATGICNDLAGYTIVSDFYDFLEEHVTDLHAADPEICDDGIDNNGDNKIDCNDPQCADALKCQPEICDDGIDNNGDNIIDCDDPQCAGALKCQPEICDDGIDNNGNNKIDCDDPLCADALKCQPEICDDGIDNNGDNIIDCDDPLCADAVSCRAEICDDGIDNNGDNKIDCDDPQCADAVSCRAEICDDNIDNNGDNKTDCDDPQCADAVSCRAEICNDGIDNNGDNKTDCDDPQCADAVSCRAEICNDGIDNNGDNKTDCDDPQCADAAVCLVLPPCPNGQNCSDEICDNGIDDNNDHLIDCDDPLCESSSACLPEICNDGIDNNGDNKIDCDDPGCDSDSACNHNNNGNNNNGNSSSIESNQAGSKKFQKPRAKSPTDSCSAAPKSGTDFGAGILAMLGLLGLGIRRRLGKSQ